MMYHVVTKNNNNDVGVCGKISGWLVADFVSVDEVVINIKSDINCIVLPCGSVYDAAQDGFIF